MSGSLEMDGDNSVYNPKSPPLQNRLETHPNSYRCDNIVNEIARSPGTHAAKRKQHLTLDAALGPLGSQKGQRDSPGLPAEGNPSPEYNQQKGNGSDARQGKPDHVRRPSTNPPTVQPLLGLDEIRRRRSRSIGSGIRDPRIAALSVQLRTRLSYAAAKVEKKWHSHTTQYQQPESLLRHRSSTPIFDTQTPLRTEQPTAEIEGQRLDASEHYPPGVPIQPSPISIADGVYPPSQPDPQNRSGMSSSEERSAPPALAPPADIDSGRANGQRRRPNPNIPTGASRYSPFPLHRRDCSQQELRADADVVLVPETPPLRPVAHHTITPHGGYPENSQSSSMEQDAIETLLFMSSPGTSGYHSNSQNSHYNLDTMNLDDTARQNVQRLEPFGGSQTRSCIPDQATNLERQAGDEIDMMLDQMSSDSEDDNDCTPTQLTRSRTDRRVVESTVRKDFLSGT